jgi:hypothetical protein
VVGAVPVVLAVANLVAEDRLSVGPAGDFGGGGRADLWIGDV